MLLLLTACSRSGGSAEDPIKGPNPTPAAQGHALPKENRSAAGSGEVFTDDDGWYICSAGAVSYYDYTSGRTMTLCAQPGCSHRDASCQAWVGNVNSFAVLDGVLYATLDDAGSGAQLVRKELSGGKVTVLEQWDNTDNHFYTATLRRFSCGKATLYVQCRITEQQADGRVDSRTEGSSLLYDLAAGSYRELSVPGTLMGFSAPLGRRGGGAEGAVPAECGGVRGAVRGERQLRAVCPPKHPAAASAVEYGERRLYRCGRS